jgi:hypothetical protein
VAAPGLSLLLAARSTGPSRRTRWLQAEAVVSPSTFLGARGLAVADDSARELRTPPCPGHIGI